MRRRELLQTATALAATGLLGETARAEEEASAPVSGPKPNILFILVDELRFPSVFPPGIHDAAGFLKKYMPNVYGLWQSGVKFSRHYTAAVACTPARGTLISGLYSQQSWLAQTITSRPTDTSSKQPSLNPAYPTYGKLLREAGYRTPYFGKWHVSILQPDERGLGLEPYGFNAKVYPDPTGSNLQGSVGDPTNGYLNDANTAYVASEWLERHSRGRSPWCATVSFVNPHDKEFFWAGTEFQTYNELFEGKKLKPFTPYSTQDHPPLVSWADDVLKNPKPQGYPSVPPNWEKATRIARTKPSTQTFVRTFSEAVWGGAFDDEDATKFGIVPYPVPKLETGIGKAPYSYWSRGLDCYTQTMTLVDQSIGQVLDSLPHEVAENTVIIFTSDHGEYAGAHGFLQGKLGTVYDEAYHVPLIVVDPTGRFTGHTDIVRHGLTSSVDMLRMLVSLGHNGSDRWIRGDLETLYGDRHNLIPMLRSARAPGREYVLLASDELVPGYFNFNNAPFHIIGLRTRFGKLGTYADWAPLTDRIIRRSIESELYDYGTAEGRAELDNLRDSPFIDPAVDFLVDYLVPYELRAPLPLSLRKPQLMSKAAYLKYEALLKHYPPPSSGSRLPRGLSPFGEDF